MKLLLTIGFLGKNDIFGFNIFLLRKFHDMCFRILISFITIVIFNSNFFASEIVLKNDSTADSIRTHPRVYYATQLTSERPVIDGKLNDACWKLGNWTGSFTQWVPKEGAKPSQPTEIKILYDDKNIYVAIRAFESEPGKIIRKKGRRDELTGDVVGINFDSYHDHRTGFEFDITAAGQKTDAVLTNPWNADFNWNAVWYAKVDIEDSAWTAEFEIPLSQLRYSNDYEQTWFMHCWRWIDRLQEESDWEPQTFKSPGMLYLFGELRGIKGLPKSRRFEIMPYVVGKLKTFQKETGNPFTVKGKYWLGNAGVDAKIGLSSNFTVDLSINPDFGQVESDPSVMNLTAFETFYEEKRPFFLEGKNIFSFDFDNNSVFYSRRIGHVPTYQPDLKDNEYIKTPDYTTILGALKLSGKSSRGLSIGILQSITADETASLFTSGVTKNLTVEPMSNYTIGRIQQDFKQGNTILGGIITSTNRIIRDSALKFMNRNAYTGGIDLLHQWNDKEFYVDAKLIGSNIDGDARAIYELQTSSARYFQRPEARYVFLDSSRTNLSGYGGSIKIGKGSKGLWRYSTELNWRSPGLDLNDLGYMQLADIIKQGNTVSYFVNQPVSIFRTYSFGISEINNWDFGKNYLSSGGSLNLYLEFLNKWAINTSINYTTQALDDRILRGGDAMLLPANLSNYFYVRTDPSRRIFFDFTSNSSFSENQSTKYFILQPGVSVMPANSLKISLSVGFSSNTDRLQYIDTKTVNDEKRYILAKIDQQTLGITFRIDYNITPEISLQYYGSPFGSAGKFSEFKSITKPKATNYNDRFVIVNPVADGTSYEISENKNNHVDYTIDIPDFNFDQFRSNLVFRWEYKPGSQIYLVWANDMTYNVKPDYSSVNSIFRKLSSVFPNNIFLIKFNYWFNI